MTSAATLATTVPDGFDIAPGLHMDDLADAFGRAGRLHVPGFLAGDGAQRLHRRMEASPDWQFIFNRGNEHFQITQPNMKAMPPEARRQLMHDIFTEARDRFQMAYDIVNITLKTPEPVTRDPLFLSFHAFLNSPAFLDAIEAMTGIRGDWCSAMATRYAPGHFCEVHNDSANDGHRLVAFVMNVTPRWRVDWGGVLQFIDGEGNVLAGYTPRFNALNLFRVPQLHAVSLVSPFAGAPRYSVAGWVMGGG